MNCLFVRHLTNLDFTFIDRQRGLVGDTWIVDLELAGELDAQGMVFDFGQVKKVIRQAVEDTLDHRLVVAEAMPGLTWSEQSGRVSIAAQSERGFIAELELPAEAVIRVPGEQVDRAALERWIADRLRPVLPPNAQDVHLTLRPEAIQGAAYHYSHGLRKHQGPCQRIAHGHRSRIEIEINGQRSQLLEYQWAKRWKDIYLVSQEDIRGHTERQGISCLDIQYQAQEGDYRLILPVSRAYVLPTDTTVELIADHIADTLHAQHPDARIRVRAYEGVNKGAIAERAPVQPA